MNNRDSERFIGAFDWNRLKAWIVIAVALTALPALSETNLSYQTPPPEIGALVDAPLAPAVSVSRDRKRLLLMERPALPNIDELAQPELRLAGLRINPLNNGPSRVTVYTGLSLLSLKDGMEVPITGLPDAARIRNVQWSPCGDFIAFTHDESERIELWIADLEDARAWRLVDAALNDMFPGSPYSWRPDGETILARLVPPDRESPPLAPLAPSGPIIQESIGRTAPARTYQDLLQNPHDEALFDYYGTSIMALIDLDGGVTHLNEPGVITRLTPSPDSQYVLATTLRKPYSYRVPYSRFANDVVVLDNEGEFVHRVVSQPLAEEIPIAFDAVIDGPRGVQWRNDAAATLVWAEAQDGGDPRSEAEIRDAIYVLNAPFDGEPRKLAEFTDRYRSIQWGGDDLALAYEGWWDDRRERIWRLAPGDVDAKPILVMERSTEDRYNDPGNPILTPDERGQWVLMRLDDGETLLYRGDGASPEGDRPFLDRFDLASGESQRLWRSEPPYYESVSAVLDDEGRRLLLSRESEQEPSNYYVLDLDAGEMTVLTDFPHPTPELRDVHKQLITYEREDGVALSATLLLPPGYDPEQDGPLPTMLWAYPREYRSADAAGQITDSPHRFNRVGYWGPDFLVAAGYAVIDRAAMPIIGEGNEEPNDTFVEQLVANAKAAIDAAVELGVTDPNRVAVGGHSYGAFMAVNLLAHSELFQAGVARSGAYNRSLTPFGFQREQRTIWEAPHVYTGMSPFFHADKIKSPLLLIHGEADNNSGTFPMQSERLYQAVQGLGGIVRLVMLPHESHGYRARESVLHMLWETLDWLDRYVKHVDLYVDPSYEGAGSASSD